MDSIGASNSLISVLILEFKMLQFQQVKRTHYIIIHCEHITVTDVLISCKLFYQRRCREIGGYLVKIDDSSEQSWVFKEAMKTKKCNYINLYYTCV